MLDNELRNEAQRLAKLDENLTEAEQAFERTERAGEELSAFSEAGVEKLHQASRDLRRWQESAEVSDELESNTVRLLNSVESFELPEIDEHMANVFEDSEDDVRHEDFPAQWSRIRGTPPVGEAGIGSLESRGTIRA